MKKNKDLPQILILKRKYIYRFPNGQNVALYHSEQLNQYITVPLDNSQFTNTTESVLNVLQNISESDEIKNVIFEDCTELNIDKECADLVLSFIDINQELKEEVGLSETSFLQILKQATETISEETGSAIEEKELQDNETDQRNND